MENWIALLLILLFYVFACLAIFMIYPIETGKKGGKKMFNLFKRRIKRRTKFEEVVEKATKKPQPLNSRGFYFCSKCDNEITREQLDKTWGWSGPRCPFCGNTGFDMLAGVIEQEAGKKGLRARRHS